MPYHGFHDSYEALPPVVRGHITREEFAWLSDDEKARLLEDMTVPELPEDCPDG